MRLYRPKVRRNGVLVETRVFWVDFAIDGRRHRVSTGCEQERAAVLRAKEIGAKYAVHGPGGDPHQATRRADPLTLVKEYVEHLRSLGRDPGHVDLTDHRLRRLFEGAARMDEMTPPRISAALDRIAKTPVGRPWQEPQTPNCGTWWPTEGAVGS